MPVDPASIPDSNSGLDPFRNFKFNLWSPVLLLLAIMFMTAISWGKWMDILVDFGSQVYVPWQLSEGKVLYKDILYFHGPLSAYIHSLVFRIFGLGISVLALFNIGLIVILTAIIHRLFRNLFDPLTGLVAALSFVIVFGFGNYLKTANYNFVCAYEYPLTHGIFLSFLTLHQFINYLNKPLPRTLFWIGLLSGLILLTKVEVFVAEIAAVGTGLLLAIQHHKTSTTNNFYRVCIFFSGFIVPTLAFIFYFSFHMPITQALGTPLAHFTYVFNSEIKSFLFYKGITGRYELSSNLSYLLVVLGVYLFIYTALILLNKGIAARYKNSWAPYWICFFVFLFLMILFRNNIPWLELVRPLPLILALHMALLIYAWFSRPQTPKNKQRQIAIFSLSIFSLVLLLKIIFNVHVYHYGFALTLPGFLLLTALLVYELPQVIIKFRGSALAPSAFGLAFMLAHVAMLGWTSYVMYQRKDFPISEGRDRIYDFAPFREGTPKHLYGRSYTFHHTLEWLNHNVGPEETFAAFPSACMLNYMSRKKSSINTVIHNPVVLLLKGEGPVLHSLMANPPDYIVLVDEEFGHLGARFFGQDFAQDIYKWILENYQVANQIGPKPFTNRGFGIQILKRGPLPLEQK